MIKRLAAVGAAAVGLGWVTVVIPAAAHAVPPHIPQGTDIICPDIAGINYVRDPEDLHAFYLCVDGSVQHQFRCPQVTVLVMGIPPKCIPFPHVRP